MYTDSGVISQDPELKYLPDSTPICNWSMAIKNSRGKTMWLKCTLFGKSAETANQWLAKGKHIQVSGELKFDESTGNPRTFTRKDGTAGASFELDVMRWKFVGGKADGDQPQPQTQTKEQSVEIDKDEIPF